MPRPKRRAIAPCVRWPFLFVSRALPENLLSNCCLFFCENIKSRGNKTINLPSILYNKQQKIYANYLKKNLMKTLRDINVLIVDEDDNKEFSESNNEKNVNDTNKKPEPFSTYLHNEAAPAMEKRKNYFFKRLSPFLLLAAFLILLFPYMFITDVVSIESIWLKIILFPVLFINVLFTDFAIWNFFEGKKRFQIWVIELTLSVFILYMLLKIIQYS